MGFFDSKRKTVNETTNNVDNTSIGLEDISGTAVVGSNNLITLSDSGALSTAARIAGDSIAAVDSARADAIGGVVDSARSGFEFGARVTADALDVVAGSREIEGRALTNAFEFANSGRAMEREAFTDALDFAGARSKESAQATNAAFFESLGFTRDVLGFAGERAAESAGAQSDAFTQSLTFAKDLFAGNLNLIGETVTGLNTIAREQSTSSDERVQSIATKALYVVGAVVLVIGAAWVFSKGHS